MVNHKTIPKYIFPLIIIIIFAGSLFFWQKSLVKKPATTDYKELAKPTALTEINRTFEFKIKDPKTPVTLKYTITNAKKVKLITIDNQPIRLKTDEEVMVISLELQNDSNYALKVNSRDFLRLVSGDKHYAPDYYNDTKDAPAISVTKDEVAFVVPASQKQFKLQIGEIDKDKTEIDINF